jgi:hypothetical protein
MVATAEGTLGAVYLVRAATRQIPVLTVMSIHSFRRAWRL